jgi:hypothetical protein
VTQIQCRTELLGEFTQRAFAPKHHLASSGHLGFKIPRNCAQLDASGSRHQGECFTRLDIEVRQNIAGQDDTRAVSNFRDFKSAVHTLVITEVGVGKQSAQLGNTLNRKFLDPRPLASLADALSSVC